MEWSDFDDFKLKYDLRTNPENCALRLSIWNNCESIGLLFREGMLDKKTLRAGSVGMIPILWYKFEPIIKMLRETDYNEDDFENFEFVAKQLRADQGISTDQLDSY